EWLLGETYDPLNVPIALFMERFSVPGEEEDPEQFEDEERKFRVSHTHPVEPPMETAASLDGSFLCREEVVQANVIFQHCASKGTFDISHADAERIAGVAIDPCAVCRSSGLGNSTEPSMKWMLRAITG
ncbi:unnamed protein product, partial [Symbiodinium necroappetens]